MKKIKLTPEQEDMIGDNVYHEKKLEEKKKKHKMFPVNPKRLDKILKKIGRRKKEVKENENEN